MISVDEAFGLIMGTSPDFGTRTVPLQEAAGLVLRQTVRADRDFPPFDRVTMDGIAISSDAFARGRRKFRRQELLPAGAAPIALANDMACVEIMTGAVLPPGTDAVVPYEQLDELRDGDDICFMIKTEVRPGQYVHRKGSDAPVGATLLEEGCRITPAAAGLLAATGVSGVQVSRQPEAVILCTGDELTAVGSIPLPHEIRQSNGYALSALLAAWGVPATLCHASDDEEAIRRLLRRFREQHVDVVISTGGVSAGKKDFLPSVFRQEGGEVLFHKVAQRPGKPLLTGYWKQGPLFFGLPGNPVSCLAACARYVIPWILEGLRTSVQPVYARLGETVTFRPSLTRFLPVRLSPDNSFRLTAWPLQGKGSGDMVGLYGAAAFLELPPEEERFAEGAVYRVWPVEPGLLPR